MAHQWALPELRKLLPLGDGELTQIVDYTAALPSDDEAAQHLQGLLGDAPEAVEFVAEFVRRRGEAAGHTVLRDTKAAAAAAATANAPAGQASQQAGPLPDKGAGPNPDNAPPPAYAPAARLQGDGNAVFSYNPHHTNPIIQAGHIRARDEQEMQQALQNLQYEYRIYNPEIEPEHDSDYYCSCSIHQYVRRKMGRLDVQRMWSKAVMYPGESFYSDVSFSPGLFSGNPYIYRVGSPFGFGYTVSSSYRWGPPRPSASAHLAWTQGTIALSNQLNREAQDKVDRKEPRENIWAETAPAGDVTNGMAGLSLDSKGFAVDSKSPAGPSSGGEQPSSESSSSAAAAKPKGGGKFARLKQNMGIKSSEQKASEAASSLRSSILAEEAGRWPDPAQRRLVADYQQKVGMARHIAALRARKPIQYLHLLRAGYFEPIPVAWANQASNPLKFSIEARGGWRGVTPTWRGYEDMAEERLYWVLNHREGSVGMRMKPDFISEMNMAQQRMATAVEPPPMYFSPDDTCFQQHTTSDHGYSKQVMPSPFRAYDQPERPTDDSMILLDVSGSMDFDPVRPMYDRYLITGYVSSTQPKNKDVAKSIIRRFTDALAHHDHQTAGYDLVTFANRATYVGTLNHRNFDHAWRGVRVGGGTRVMTGWQMVKERHFEKHRESAVHHPVYGWQAGPETPILRLLLFLDGEATDMDEFELDLLGLSWAHVTIFLIGVDNCPHHHRHANELQRISDVNHHVSFVDAQGNCPERFVTHELLKRHLGYDITLSEFEQMEQLPAYSAVA